MMLGTKKAVSSLLLMVFMISAFGSCKALKQTKCDLCPEFTQAENTTTPDLVCIEE